MSLFALLAWSALAVKPVQAPFRAELETLDWAGHSTGVVATFEGEPSRARGEAALDACIPWASGRVTGRAGFLKTKVARLLVAHPVEPASARAVLALASCLSKQDGVKEAHAWFFPGADSGLEVEASWRFQQGVRLSRQLRAYRDDPEYTAYARRKLARAEWVAHLWKGYPLSELARALGLPGREALERHGALMWEGAAAPDDAGEDLVRVVIYLPTGAALQVLQRAEAKKVSASSLLGGALAAAQKDGKLGSGELPASEPTSKERALTVWLPRPALAAAEAVSDARGESLSVLVAKAWHRAEDGGKKKD